jgi:hypothetical protein
LHISIQAIYLRAVAERDEGHVAYKEPSCWLFRDAYLLPRISGLKVEHAPMPRLPAGVDYVAFLTFIRVH